MTPGEEDVVRAALRLGERPVVAWADPGRAVVVTVAGVELTRAVRDADGPWLLVTLSGHTPMGTHRDMPALVAWAAAWWLAHLTAAPGRERDADTYRALYDQARALPGGVRRSAW